MSLYEPSYSALGLETRDAAPKKQENSPTPSGTHGAFRSRQLILCLVEMSANGYLAFEHGSAATEYYVYLTLGLFFGTTTLWPGPSLVQRAIGSTLFGSLCVCLRGEVISASLYACQSLACVLSFAAIVKRVQAKVTAAWYFGTAFSNWNRPGLVLAFICLGVACHWRARLEQAAESKLRGDES
jgi:hypothetical protein